MAQYPIKMLKDESGTPFVPLVAPEAVKDGQGFDLPAVLNNKLEKTNIIAGTNITLSVSENDITINSTAGGATTNIIDNLDQTTSGVGVLDAHQGYVLKGMIPGVQNNLTSTSTTDALSAYQGYLLSNRVVPSGGTANQVLAKDSATDNDVKWLTLPSVVDNLTSTSTTDALSANQGSVLDSKFASYLPLSGGTVTGNLVVQGDTTLNKADSGVVKVLGTASNGSFRTRVINGITADGTAYDDLHLQYGANKAIKLGNTASYTISADGSTYSGTSAVANKLGTSNVGTSDRPIYLASGTPTQCNTPASGNYFRGIPFISSGGVMEVGRYIDFHPTNGSTADYSKRIDAGTGTTGRVLTLPDKTGTLALEYKNLYANDSGAASVTLSETAANFSYIDVTFKQMNQTQRGMTRVYAPNGKTFNMSILDGDGGGMGWFTATASISGTSISISKGESLAIYNPTVGQALYCAGKSINEMRILRVDGYR